MNQPSATTTLQSQLEALRPVYEKSKARENGEDQEWEIRKSALLLGVYRAVRSFKDVDPSSKAVHILGRIQAAIAELDQPRLNVLEYENKRKDYARQCSLNGVSAVQF